MSMADGQAELATYPARIAELEHAVNHILTAFRRRASLGTWDPGDLLTRRPYPTLGPREEPPAPAASPDEETHGPFEQEVFSQRVVVAILSKDVAVIRRVLGVSPGMAQAIADAANELYRRGELNSWKRANEMLREARTPGDI